MYERALAVEQEKLGAAHPSLATTLSNLAELHRAEGHLDEAIKFHRRALDLRKQALGPNHPETAQSLNNLAVTYFEKGEYDKAEQLYERSVAVKEGDARHGASRGRADAQQPRRAVPAAAAS